MPAQLIFCLLGPTASGKTALAGELIKHYPFDIISVDSAMIYREMNIGTAKPTLLELQKVPHQLIDIVNPDESYSAAQFCSDALSLITKSSTGGKIPLLVGGTMMYFNALQKGLSPLPQANLEIREQLVQEAAIQGWEGMHRQLLKIDPEAAARIHAHDAQRIQRALEVYYVTGTSLSDFLLQQRTRPGYRFVNLILFPQQRAWLHERIALRFEQMLAQGLVEEVEYLQQKWQITSNSPSMRSVGYRQVLDFLKGEVNYASMRDKALAATRQVAKRQLTWLRHWEQGIYYDPQNSGFTVEILAQTQEILDNP